ncbi:hypothetical protein N8460_06615 [Oceanospirillaceae bacterium]|nr:hypothetical protein [Oceanospirillaceae bacterium]
MANQFDLNTPYPSVGPERDQAAYVSTRATFRNGRCKRHSGASTGLINQAFGKDHHRYTHGLRTKEVIGMRELLADMHKSLGGL